MFSQLSGTYGALPKNTHQSPACRAGDFVGTTEKHCQKRKNSPLKPPPSSSKLTWRHASTKSKVGKQNSIPGLNSVCGEQRKSSDIWAKFLYMRKVSLPWNRSWNDGMKRRRWITLYNSQTVLSRVIHVTHLQLTSSFPSLFFFSPKVTGGIFFSCCTKSAKNGVTKKKKKRSLKKPQTQKIFQSATLKIT